MVFFALRVSSGQELSAVRILKARAESLGIPVKSMVFIPRMKGYLFVEADRAHDVSRLVRGVSRVKMLQTDPISFDEIKSMIIKEPEKVVVKAGDIVKIIKGNFKGYQAKVLSVVESEKGVTLNLELVGLGKPWEIRLPLEHVKLAEPKEVEE